MKPPTLALALAAPSFACRARPGAGTPYLGRATVADAASRLRKEE